jgi:transposase
VREALNGLVDQIVALGRQMDRMEKQMRRFCWENENAERLVTIPCVGPVAASAILAGAPDMGGFRSGRDFAARLGLVPRQSSSGSKERLGGIAKMGDRSIRRLLVTGALSVIHWRRRDPGFAESWLGKITARKPVKPAAVALANKVARIAWALLTRGEVYQAA